jgi:hypothetical protein
MTEFQAGQIVEILTDGHTNFLEKRGGKWLPMAEVVEVLDNGWVKVQPGTVANPLRAYTMNLRPDMIRLMDANDPRNRK